jgi:membrane protease YdiL (CAAX protease family)
MNEDESVIDIDPDDNSVNDAAEEMTDENPVNDAEVISTDENAFCDDNETEGSEVAENDTGTNDATQVIQSEVYAQSAWEAPVAIVRNADEVKAEASPATPEKKYKKTLRGIFLILCLFPVLSVIVVLPTVIYSLFSYGISASDISGDIEFLLSFAIPQFLYPLLTAIASVFMAVIAGRRVKDTVKIANAPATDVLLSIGIFLGIGTAGSYLSQLITDLIVGLGVPVPDMSEFMPDPQTPMQFCLYLIVIAVMPAICEEFIFRGIICGLIKEYNKTAAIILSALAFSLVHATVQQIPFAFIMGLFLGYIYVKYDTLLIGIVLHFINNFISCIFTVLYGRIPEGTYETLYTVYDIATVVIGIVTLTVFIIRRIRERKENPNREIAAVSGGKLVAATLSSWAMWLFIVIYIFETVSTILMSAYM